MSKDREANRVLKRAQELLRSGMNGGLTIRKSARVEQPIPVLEPNRSLHSWFAPVTVGELLVGFFQFQPDLTLMRYSSFQRHEDSLEGCPAAELWIDPKSIRCRIDEKVHQDEKIRELFFTYDRTPSRLAWAVVLDAHDGTIRTLHVAGNAVWEATTPNTGENSFGG